jgi:hypothetical protein
MHESPATPRTLNLIAGGMSIEEWVLHAAWFQSHQAYR